MRGVSRIIEAVFILIITVSMIALTYQWSFEYSSATQEKIEKNLAQKGCLKIENIDVINKKITVRNCGDTGLSNFILYLDSEPIATYSGTLNSVGITQISYNRDINFGNHEIFVSSTYAESPKIMFNIPSQPPTLPCDYYIFNANIPYTITQSNKLYCLAENVESQKNITENLGDSYLLESFPIGNYGSEVDLDVESSLDLKNTRSIVKFGLSSIPPGSKIKDVKLMLYNDGGGGSCTLNVSVYNSSQNWEESTVTWNNMPNLDTYQDNKTASLGNYIGWSVTNAVKAAYNMGRNVSFIIKATIENITGMPYPYACWLSYSSKEGSHPPYLEITYDESAIDFSSGVQNTTLDCQGYNVDGNDIASTNGIYLKSAKNNTLKYCNITDFETGVFILASNNNTVTNMKINSNSLGLSISGSSYIMITNSTMNNGYNINLWNSTNFSSVVNNILVDDDGQSIYLVDASVNNMFLGNNISGANDQIWVDAGPKNNSFINNYITSYGYNAFSMFGGGTTNNSVTGGSIRSIPNNFDQCDYAFFISASNNYFRSTNFTDTRYICLDSNIWFNYNNDTTGELWLKTKLSASSAIKRNLYSWSQNLIKWNETSLYLSTATYNLTGLVPGYNYNVYNNTALVYTLSSGPSGAINFTINLPAGLQREIRVEKAYCDYYIFSSNIPYAITQNNSYYCLAENAYISGSGDPTAVKFNAQNTTLDCQGFSLSSDGNGNSYGINITSINYKNNTIKNCNIISFNRGIQISGSSNNTVDNSTFNGNSDRGIYIFGSNSTIITNNIANNNGVYGIFIYNSNSSILTNNTAKNNDMYGISIINGNNGLLTNNIFNQNSEDGIYLCNAFGNNITDGSFYGNAVYDYDFCITGTNNNFTDTNFTSSRTINIRDSPSWFNYANSSSSLLAFGKTDIGGNTESWSEGREVLSKFTLGTSASIQSITAYLQVNAGGHITYAIYNVSGSAPGTLLGKTQEINAPAGGEWEWQTASFASPLALSSGDYYLLASSDVAFQIKYDSLVSDGYHDSYGDHTYPNFPSIWSGGVADDMKRSIYATYISNIWLKTNVSAASTITRKLINWNQTLMQWNDTASAAITARYNITGLSTSSNYNAYNNGALISGSPFPSGLSGVISFTTSLPLNSERNITVQKV